MVRCFLVLEDGTVVEGIGFGHQKDVFGEVVFNTGMTGYQEALTDPSYTGQILVSSYPLIGNYGTTPDFMQSEAVHVNGFVVREWCEHPSRMYKGDTVDAFLKKNSVPGISGIDTRDLIINIRDRGTMRGAITYREDIDEVLAEVRGMPLPSESNLVAEMSPKSTIRIDSGKALTVGLLDCGCKHGIIRDLASRFNVIRIPYNMGAQEILDLGVDGIMVSNGPGDPSHPGLQKTERTVKDLAHERPMMAICLGSQLVARAFGGDTYKMKFGHRGANQSVKFEGRV
ncbi:MAG: glutamine-hydrolyzing carbamoyl-phosphate synthase small subunit, partial [Candidatus Methanomethylophilaceae archaeon]